MEMYDEDGNPLEFSGDDDEAILNWIYVDLTETSGQWRCCRIT